MPPENQTKITAYPCEALRKLGLPNPKQPNQRPQNSSIQVLGSEPLQIQHQDCPPNGLVIVCSPVKI